MSGMDMLMKSFGIDPNLIKEQGQLLGNGLRNFDARLTRVEELLSQINKKLDSLVELTEPEIPVKESPIYRVVT